MTIAALGILAGCWYFGSILTAVLLASAAIAEICVLLQILASVAELPANRPMFSGRPFLFALDRDVAS
jgi:hypothetical protein